MRLIDTTLSGHLGASVTTLCLCWRLTRHDGMILRLTEHDQPIEIAGERFEPGAAVEAASFTQSTRLRVGQADCGGALSHDAITKADLLAGLWDGARIDVFRADWQSKTALLAVWSGTLSSIAQREGRFEAELVSLKAAFEALIGRVLMRGCDAAFGDARCGVDKAAFPGASCDHRFETCRTTFDNAVNFRGFPHMPGNDFLLSGPGASGNTGGKR